MKGWSLKIKVTLVYTLFMTLLTCVSLGLLFSLSSQEILESVQKELEDRVYDSTEEISVKKEKLVPDRDFYNLEDGVYLSLYDMDGNFLFGRIPYGIQEKAEFSEGQIQTVGKEENKWYVFDVKYHPGAFQDVYIRGICSVSHAESGIKTVRRVAVILLPLLVLFMGGAGYFFIGRTLWPVKQITETVRSIQKDRDLSKRVGLSHGKDEICEMANTFDDMLTQIEDTVQREKQFTSDVSHELRMPAAVILAQCEELLEEENLTDNQRIQLCRIQKKAAEMSNMISSLLFLSRADQGRQMLTKELVNISELTEMSALEMGLLAEKEQIHLQTDIQENLYAKVDESLYIRMLINLLSNAIAYHREHGYIKVSLFRIENRIVGKIEDNGQGISQEDLPHIWERFYRADRARTQGNHSGLGLPMVKWIAEAHGGKIQVESCLGRGTCFTFWLPTEENGEKK